MMGKVLARGREALAELLGFGRECSGSESSTYVTPGDAWMQYVPSLALESMAARRGTERSPLAAAVTTSQTV